MLTKKIFLVSVLIFMILACDEKARPPKNIVNEETMAKILTEIHLAEAKVSQLSFGDYDSTKAAYKYLELQIMTKYKMDTARYRASYDYYLTKPEQMAALYDGVVRNLEELKKKKKMAY